MMADSRAGARRAVTIRAVLFDLDGTLLDRRATFRHHLERQVARHPHIFQDVGMEACVEALLGLDENGTVDRDEFYRRAESRFGLAPGAGLALRADFKTHFPELCVPYRDMVPTLERLKARNLRLGVVTNGSVRTQTRKIDGLGIRPLLDCVLISEALGWHKPDRRIFQAALTELRVSASEAVFVGDNPAADVTGAKQADLFAIWKRDDYWPEPQDADIVIDEIRELPDHLDPIPTTGARAGLGP